MKENNKNYIPTSYPDQHGLFGPSFSADTAYSPVHFAVNNGDLAALIFWIHAGAPLDTTVKFGPYQHKTPLYLAIAAKHNHIIPLLLQYPLNLNAVPYLALAIRQSISLDNIKRLFDRGASIWHMWDEQLPLDYASLHHWHDVISLIANLSNITNLEINMLIHQMTVGQPHLSKEKALRRKSAYLTVIKSWIAQMGPAAESAIYEDIPLLHRVMLCCGEDLAITALKRGANHTEVTSTGITALHLAVMCNYQRFANILVGMSSDFSTKDYTGATAFNHALDYARTLNIAQQMIASSNMVHCDAFYLYDSYKQLRIEWLDHCIRRLLNSQPHLREKWKEFNLSKLCAHIFNIGDYNLLTPSGTTSNPKSYIRGGLLAPMGLLHKIMKCTREMGDFIPSHFKDLIISLCDLPSRNASITNADYLFHIKSRKPALIITGQWAHAQYILIYQSYFIFCDGSSQRIAFHRYNESALTEELIGKLRYDRAYTDPSEQTQSILKSVYNAISLTLDPQSEAYACHIQWEAQTVENCTFKSFEVAVIMLFAIENIVSNGPAHDTLASDAKSIRLWIWELKLHFAEKYIALHDGTQSSFQPDHKLISQIRSQLSIRPPSINAQQVRAHALLEAIKRLNLGKMTANHDSPVMVDSCFSHFFLYPQAQATGPTYESLLPLRKFSLR